MNTGSFAISVHILTLLAHYPESLLSSSKIAESININPVLVRKELLKLKKARLIEVKPGINGGSCLAKQAADIHLSEVFIVTQHEHVFSFAKNKPNENCPVGKSINEWLDKLYTDIDKNIFILLENKTLAEFLQQ